MTARCPKLPSSDADVKTPPLWHTAAKCRAALVTDGSFHGPFPLYRRWNWKGSIVDALMTAVIPRIKTQFDSVVGTCARSHISIAINQALAT